VLKPRSEPEDIESGFDAEDEFAPTPAESWRDEPTEGADPIPAEAASEDEDAIPPIVNPYRLLAEADVDEDPWIDPDKDRSEPEPGASESGFATYDTATPQIVETEIVPPEGRDPFAPDPRAPEAYTRESVEAFEEPLEPPPPEPQAAYSAALAIEPPHSSEPTLGDAAVPRISIHIFCERADTAAAAENATGDRRMARASAVVIMGGLAAAVEQYQNQPTPSLVIVESQDHGPLLIQLLDRLAEVCDPGTKVVVIGGHNDIALYRELMRRGVSEYLVPPVQTLQLIRAITTLYTDPSAPFVGRQIAFCGARGGVGSSTIAHNLAYTLSERMMTNTVIVDFDLPFGTAGLDFNQDPLQGVADALSQPDRLDPVLLDRMMARCTDRLSLFAAPATLDDDYEISPEAFEEVASKIRTTAPYVVLDLPHLWSNWMRKVLLTADDVVITATPDLACLRNAKNIVDLMRQTRANDAPPWLVLNQVGVPGRPEIPLKDFTTALGLEPALVMPFDPKLFGQAANNGQMIEEMGDKSKAALGLHQLAQILARREAPPAPKKSFLDSLLKRK
jgi:pilus assembly protein CpaE